MKQKNRTNGFWLIYRMIKSSLVMFWIGWYWPSSFYRSSLVVMSGLMNAFKILLNVILFFGNDQMSQWMENHSSWNTWSINFLLCSHICLRRLLVPPVAFLMCPSSIRLQGIIWLHSWTPRCTTTTVVSHTNSPKNVTTLPNTSILWHFTVQDFLSSKPSPSSTVSSSLQASTTSPSQKRNYLELGVPSLEQPQSSLPLSGQNLVPPAIESSSPMLSLSSNGFILAEVSNQLHQFSCL